MSELVIPSSLKGIIKFEPVTDDKGEVVEGKYNPNTDTISLDPKSSNITTLCEELYHRKQHQYLVAQGLYGEITPLHDAFYSYAGEVGIIPTIRTIALKHNHEEGLEDEDVTKTYVRYFQEAASFVYFYDRVDLDTSRRFFQVVRGHRLFAGIQGTMDYLNRGYTPETFMFLSQFSDARTEKETWDLVEEGQKRWMQVQ